MKNFIERRIRRRAVNHIRARYELIKPTPKKGMFNHKCFFNAVEYAYKRKGVEVIEVVYIDNGWPILHYINLNRKGQYLETTLGFFANNYEYYYIRKIHKDDWGNIGEEFNNSLNSWTKEFVTPFYKFVFGIKDIF